MNRTYIEHDQIQDTKTIINIQTDGFDVVLNCSHNSVFECVSCTVIFGAWSTLGLTNIQIIQIIPKFVKKISAY